MFYNRRGSLVTEVEFIETNGDHEISPLELSAKFTIFILVSLMVFIYITA